MWNRIKKMYEDLYIRESKTEDRLFSFFIMMGAAMAVISLLETVMITNTLLSSFPIVILFVFLILILRFVASRVQIDHAKGIIWGIITFIIFPILFLENGALEGGAPFSLMVPYLYTCMMYNGNRMRVMLLIDTCVNIVIYGVAYHRPTLVVDTYNKTFVYLDSLFNLVLIGVGIGVVLYFQKKILENEKNRVIEQAEQIKQLSQSKERFFASMSHELRTPINSIIGMNEMVRRKTEKTEVLEYVDNINKASHMLLNLVNDILDFSQIELDQMEIHPAVYHTKDIIKDVIGMMAVRAEEKGLEFHVEVDENLPRKLYGDQKRVQQIMLNILTNAVKYTNQGSVTLVVYGEKTDENILTMTISVADTGVGIKKEELQYLYDSFHRINTKENNKIEGSGLGLSITKQLIELMDGDIKVDSIYTKGSTFTVNIKQKIEDDTAIGNLDFAASFNREVSKYEVLFTAPNARVLIVDDNPMNLKVMENLLEDTMVQIDKANSGMEALHKTKEKAYDVIFLDNRMSGMDGIETNRKIRAQENGLCREAEIILCTAEDANVAVKKVEDYNFNDYLAKPIESTELERMLLKHLPFDLVENSEDFDTAQQQQTDHFFFRKKKRVLITTDCVADIPQEQIEKYDIGIMYLYIKTPTGRFADTMEIDSANLVKYEDSDGFYAFAEGATPEEFEEFFADALTKADDVIHITMASRVGHSFEYAQSAAAGFDHVTIVDSERVACGEGLLVLSAARKAMEGISKDKVLEHIMETKAKIGNVFMIQNADISYRTGYTKRSTKYFVDLFNVHPIMATRQSRMRMIGFQRGKLENCWKKFIHRQIRKHRKHISNEIIFINHSSLSVEQVELLKKFVREEMDFEHVLVQRSSFSTSCRSGKNMIGISFLLNE